MTYFIQACVKNGQIFTVRAQTHLIVGYCVNDVIDFAINAEIDGDQADAGDVISALVLTGQVLSGLPILAQAVVQQTSEL